MTQILELFFDLAVGWPLFLIGIAGLIGAFVIGLLSTMLLTFRGEFREAIPAVLLLLVVVGVGVGIIPNGKYIGPPAAMMATLLTLRAHALRSRDGHLDWLDGIMMGVAVITFFAMAVPLGFLFYSSLSG